ncbi:hypothetical protein [Aquisphaera insulae]|uniref:hypothetical protein n=1 Tax=Aquisphaera insulae TaxID=2712864 RepID=UPI0013EBB41C|nr:hypothetical protein [Aquisphaera insulae]
MYRIFISACFLLLIATADPASAADPPGVPSLDELAGDWMPTGSLENLPSVCNFAGGVKATDNLTGFTCLTVPPASQGGTAASVLLDGRPIPASESRWLPYEVRRRTVVEGVAMESALRMAFERPGVLIRLTMENTGKAPRTLKIALDPTCRVRSYEPERWRTWATPRPGEGEAAGPTRASFASVQPPEGDPPRWTITLAPGGRSVLELVVSVAADPGLARRWAADFDATFEAAKARWEDRWRAAFRPGNDHFSGHLPTLVTADPRIRRVYYHGALVPLLMCRTTFPFSRRCYVTVGPEWGSTLTYFWDTGMWATAWALLDPAVMREQLARWFALDRDACYAVDGLSGKGAGPWYAANDWSIFRCLDAYLATTGDLAFLKADAAGRTILDRLDELATAFEKRPLSAGSPLADYGGKDNLLECSPTYVRGVPSLNAANVAMLRRAAAYQDLSGHHARAGELRARAEGLLPAVLSLYEPGQGVWSAVDGSGRRVPLRHCFDFIMIGHALDRDLTGEVKAEMIGFVDRELRTETWMRAMSLKDPAAAESDRPDHGPMGSYDGWPALTMAVFCRFGRDDEAVEFLRAAEQVTHEGPFSQSHDFVGPDSRGRSPVVRIARRGGQDFNEGCGAAFADVIIGDFFGFRPDLGGEASGFPLRAPTSPRGFEGTLHHVSYRGESYAITAGGHGVRGRKE